MNNGDISARVASSAENSDVQFSLERYKFILGEKRFLNENVHRYLTLFQTLMTAIVGAGATVFISWKKLDLGPEMARITIQMLLGLLIILAIFVILALVSGIFSWFDYRNEEIDLLEKNVGSATHARPSIRNFMRWQETYVLLLMVIVIASSYYFVERAVIPAIR